MIWRFGDDIDTDVLAPGQYMSGGIDKLAAHCLEAVNPEFAARARPGDIVIGGRNFGVGSSREQAAQALKHLGIAAVIAPNFAGIFYRNAINLGLPVLVGHVPETVRTGDVAEIDIESGMLRAGTQVQCEPLPGFLLDLIRAGGLVPHLKQRFKSAS
ncbi:MAG: 3-isopropylmalate dehydratase [Sedimentitalea sp.]